MQFVNAVIADLSVNGTRLRADFEELATIGGDAAGGVTRLALSPADIHARAWFADHLEAAGLRVIDDDAANLSGVLACADPAAPTLLIGSHLDTVPDGGRYDGAVGICAALECVRTIRESGVQLPFHLEVIDFTDDEGHWASLFGARALTGMLKPDDLFDTRRDNASLRAALRSVGSDPRRALHVRRDPESLAGYLELHIEHGTRLERSHTPIGIVTAIVGRKTHRITFLGQAGHSGTTDMYKRRDALRGAALFIVRAHDAMRARYGDGIFHCGDVDVFPGKFNIIPSEAVCTVEVRHVNETLMGDMERAMLQIARECAASYALDARMELVTHMPAASMSDALMTAIDAVCQHMGIPAMPLASYAGHAGQFMAGITPTGMIFIPSVDGIGHSPREYTAWEDVERGANVLLHTILHYAARQA
ncbi:MAG: M20 family metallo-hydrolase [bacterium]|nr:M20 family metallo-hydrolase [bacterium]